MALFSILVQGHGLSFKKGITVVNCLKTFLVLKAKSRLSVRAPR